MILTRPLERSSQVWTPSDMPWSGPKASVSDGMLVVNAPGIDANVDLRSREARVATGFGRALEAFLRVLLPIALADGAVFHAAMLVREGRALLGVGNSGSGKSTLAGLVPDLACADEHAAVRLLGDEPAAFALPFWHARPLRARLVALCLLEHGAEHRLDEVRKEDAYRLLVPHVLWPIPAPDVNTQAFATLARLVRDVPVYRLSFRVDASVREVLPFG